VHRHGVVHRDLKPHNVILAPSGPQLIDFGIARAHEHSTITHTGQVPGTPGYIAPEVLMGDADTSPAADIFALGATMAAAVTGREPFGEGEWWTISFRAVRGEINLDGVEADLAALIRECTARVAERRPSPEAIVGRCGAVATLAEHPAYRELAGSRPVAGGKPEKGPVTASPPGRGRRRARVVGLAAAAVAVVLTVGITVAALGGDDAGDAADGEDATTASGPPAADPMGIADGYLGGWYGEYGTRGEDGWRVLYYEIQQDGVGAVGKSVGTATVTSVDTMCAYDMRFESFENNRLSFTTVADHSVPDTTEAQETCRDSPEAQTLRLRSDGEMRRTVTGNQARLTSVGPVGQQAVPDQFLISYYYDEDGRGNGFGVRINMQQGAVGDPVLRWNDEYGCVAENELAAVDGNRLLLSPDIVINTVDVGCRPRSSAWVWAEDGGNFLRTDWTDTPDEDS
jgi:hypothetical protein